MPRFDVESGDYSTGGLPRTTLPTDQQAAPLPAAPTGYGHPTYDRIANIYKEITGGQYTPSHGEVSQWGPDVDWNYEQKIRGAIGNWWNQQSRPQQPTSTPSQTPSSDGGGGAGGGGGGYDPTSGQYIAPPATTGGGTSVFSDPATRAYEQQLNALIERLNQSYTPPSFGPAMDYLGRYFKQLQGPAYTPAQMDLIQTQTLDPLERQHAAARQQVIERLGARGIAPSSGIVEKALENVDNQFSTLRTQAQSGFARQAIDLARRNAAEAAVLGPQMASLEQQLFGTNEGRALQAANLGGIIPQMAWSRLTGAGSQIQPLNPASLLSPLYSFQQQGYQQGSDFMSQLMQALTQYFRAG